MNADIVMVRALHTMYFAIWIDSIVVDSGDKVALNCLGNLVISSDRFASVKL